MRQVFQEYELKEKRWVVHNMKTMIKLDDGYGMTCQRSKLNIGMNYQRGEKDG